MTDHFDKLKSLIDKQRREQAENEDQSRKRRKMEDEIEEHRKQRFHDSYLLHRPVIAKVLEEFGQIIWGSQVDVDKKTHRSLLRKRYTLTENANNGLWTISETLSVEPASSHYGSPLAEILTRIRGTSRRVYVIKANASSNGEIDSFYVGFISEKSERSWGGDYVEKQCIAGVKTVLSEKKIAQALTNAYENGELFKEKADLLDF
jgi:hypothetical protein